MSSRKNWNNGKREQATKTKNRNIRKGLEKNNIVIFGLNKALEEISIDSNGESLKSLVGVNVVETDIADIYPLGENTNCPKKVEFLSYSTKNEILSRRSKLKGTNVVISNDLTHQQRKENGILGKHMKNAGTNGKQVYIKGNRLVVENKVYTIEDLEEDEIESVEGNLEEKTSNTMDRKEAAGFKGQAEGGHQYKYNTRIAGRNLKIESNSK
ncbi:hypothetical protein HHI36_020163 [Cryptolaemus montrouzieri]|uniref:Uncharacterized protein n=1 Tax=Cryptolaemus montrouzieri TaxID=559131 RepID=A0ABD2NA36_9CUCU